MPEFFAFTQGAETNPRLSVPETSPLLVGRFRAVVPPRAPGEPLLSGRASPVRPIRPVRPVRPAKSRSATARDEFNQPTPSFVSKRPWAAPGAGAGVGAGVGVGVGVLPSRSPSPFFGGGSNAGRRPGPSPLLRAGTSSGGMAGVSSHALSSDGHGFYHNAHYGTIAAAGFYDGVGEEEEEDEEDETSNDDEETSNDDDDDDDDDYAFDEPETAAPRDVHQPRPHQLVPRRSQSGLWWVSQLFAPPDDTQPAGVSVASGPQSHRLLLRRSDTTRTTRTTRPHLRQIRRLRRKTRSCGRRVARWARRCGVRTGRHLRNLWITPTNAAVRRAVDRWWGRWTLLVVLPALLAVAWCAVPFPQSPIGDYGDDDDDDGRRHRTPGHGEARVQINFWFFLFAYYGPYNMTALVWITKVFNLYSLNWWPSSLGFVPSVSCLAVLSVAVPAAVFVGVPPAAFLASRNTAWVSWTFAVMAMPVAAALLLLVVHERHRMLPAASLSSAPALPVLSASRVSRISSGWLPASFVRFLWLMGALFTSLLVYVLGEASASLFLAGLPEMHHATFYAVAYVYAWTLTVFLLDALTSWILGGRQGERVGSYPLGWVFKLYFMLTYQTYVRALYVRLRSPSQVVSLQLLSSTTLIVVTPLLMCPWTHRVLCAVGLNGQSYGAFQKVCVRNVFVRFVAENASMLAFLGSLVVLHAGPNRDVYPYFAFDDDLRSNGYTFHFTLYASAVAWACELGAAVVVSALIRVFFGVSVVAEAKMDLAVWPELLPTSVAVTVHVLQNMLFSIIRLQFW